MNLLTRLRGLLPGSPAARARNAYAQATWQANASWTELDEGAAADAPRRAQLLEDIAYSERQMATSYRAGYGARNAEADALEAVRVHNDKALLLEVLASTASADNPWSRVSGRPSWETAFSADLNDLTTARNIPEYIAELLTRLYFPAYRLLGEDVTETVDRLNAAVVRAVIATTHNKNAPTWRCPACDTYNADDSSTCMVCDHTKAAV